MAPRGIPAARRVWSVTRQAFVQFFDDGAMQLGAAIAFYSALSLAPLVVLFLVLAGRFWTEATVRDEILSQARSMIGSDGAAVIDTVIQKSNQPGSGAAALAGAAVLLFGATTVFAQLQYALNTVWRVRARADRGFLHLLRVRLLSLGLIVAIGFLMLVSLVGSSVVSFVVGRFYLDVPGSALAWQLTSLAGSIVVFTLLFAMMFRVLPDVEIAWRDVGLGAFLTATLFAVGKEAIGLYLGQSSVSSSYGAAGSLVVLLLWVYYASLILLLGAELTQVLAQRRGKPIRPSLHAEAIDASRTDGAPEHSGERAEKRTGPWGPVRES